MSQVLANKQFNHEVENILKALAAKKEMPAYRNANRPLIAKKKFKLPRY
jgi:hypothetical protein